MIYFWYSGATDVTGKALVEALEAEGTRNKPRARTGDIVVGWGAKVNNSVTFNRGISVINHPNKILANRNKFKALTTMKNSAFNQVDYYIANFVSSNEVLDALRSNRLSLPLVGRTNFHQSGKGFWLCLTKAHVQNATNDGAQYFQEYIDIKSEYRLHVMNGKVIYAVKKVSNANIDHWIEQRKDKIVDYAEKNNVDLDNNTIAYVLKIISKEVQLPDWIVRSNKRGWKFSSIRLNNISNRLKTAAIKAVDALGLQFGAVDCCVDQNDIPYIIEVNTGPGLTGTSFNKYVEAFREMFNNINNENRNQNRPIRQRRAAVGVAEINDEQIIDPAPIVDANINEGIVRMVRNIQSDEEARAVIGLLLRGGVR